MSSKKVVVFDLDQTLGDFGQVGILWDVIQQHSKKKLNELDFYSILDVNPHILRPNIINILKFLKKQKEAGNCAKIIIFTNNTGKRKWPLMIKRYLEYKLGDKLFDRTICAYKVGGEIIEQQRTSYDKSYKDFLNASKLTDNIQVCFIDDQHHPQMYKPNVMYIRIPPYHAVAHPYGMALSYLKQKQNTHVHDPQQFLQHATQSLTIPPRAYDPEAYKHNGYLLMKHIQRFLLSK